MGGLWRAVEKAEVVEVAAVWGGSSGEGESRGVGRP